MKTNNEPVIIDGYEIVEDLGNNKYTIISKDNYYIYNSETKTLSEQYSKIEKFIDGLAIVKIGSMYSFINTDGEIIVKDYMKKDYWFYKVNKFIGDYAIITHEIYHTNEPLKVLKRDGTLLETPFANISPIFNNFPIIKIPDMYVDDVYVENYLNLDTGLPLLSKNVSRCHHFIGDTAIIEDGGYVYQIDTKGNKTKLN